MGFLAKARKAIRSPNTWMTLAGGPLLGQAGAALGMVRDWQGRANPERGPEDFNSPEQTALAESLAPTPGNPMIGSWRDAAERSFLGAGGNPAAAAAAGMRAQTQGMSGLAGVALPAWQRYMGLQQQAQGQKSAIPTTSPENAFLQGFLGGGGAVGLGGMLGGMGGGASGGVSGANSQQAWQKLGRAGPGGYR